MVFTEVLRQLQYRVTRIFNKSVYLNKNKIQTILDLQDGIFPLEQYAYFGNKDVFVFSLVIFTILTHKLYTTHFYKSRTKMNVCQWIETVQ